MTKSFDLVALGEILIDFTENQTSAAGMRLFEQNPGGAVANVLCMGSRLGLSTAFVGKAGKDIHGEFLKEILIKEGVNTQGLILDPAFFTTLAFVTLDINNEPHFDFARKPGADTQLNKPEVNKSIISEAKYFHIGSLSLTDEPSRSTTLYALDLAKNSGAIISYDPNYRASLWSDRERAKQQMRMVLPFINIIKLAENETEIITDLKDPAAAGAKLIEMGLDCAVITLGDKGALICIKEGTTNIEAFKTETIDTTGAGDAFWGAFLYKMITEQITPKSLSLNKATEFGRFASAAASICISRRGAIPALPYLEEIETLARS